MMNFPKNDPAISEEKAMVHTYLDAAVAVIVSLDQLGKVTFVNHACVELLGCSSADIVGRDWVQHFTPQRHRECMRRTISLVIAGETPRTFEGWILTKDGQEKLLDWHNILLRDPQGGIIGILMSGEELTKCKGTEGGLRRRESLLLSVFDSAQECIMIKDASLEYVEVNPAFCKLMRLEESEIVGRRAEDLFGAEIGKEISARAARVLEGESIESEQTRVVRGHRMTFHDSITPLRDAGGNIIGLFYISRDVTERKQIVEDVQVQTDDYPSRAMQETLAKSLVAACNDSTVLFQGESGSGKDFLAKWIHARSRRSIGPFFSINCAALPRELAESELFGHERGAFTGANRLKKGLLELAEGGTILLNEIGELDLSLQAKLLAFLDTRSFLRIGGQKQVYVNARLMAASHRVLMKEVEQKRFLQPLYYRLSVFPIRVPPLRERPEDLPILARDLIQVLATDMQLPRRPEVDSQVIKDLIDYEWPGNVRELRNVLERSLILWKGGPFHLELPKAEKFGGEWSYTVRHLPNQTFHDIVNNVSTVLCHHAVKMCDGNKKDAARLLQISRETLYKYLSKL